MYGSIRPDNECLSKLHEQVTDIKNPVTQLTGKMYHPINVENNLKSNVESNTSDVSAIYIVDWSNLFFTAMQSKMVKKSKTCGRFDQVVTYLKKVIERHGSVSKHSLVGCSGLDQECVKKLTDLGLNVYMEPQGKELNVDSQLMVRMITSVYNCEKPLDIVVITSDYNNENFTSFPWIMRSIARNCIRVHHYDTKKFKAQPRQKRMFLTAHEDGLGPYSGYYANYYIGDIDNLEPVLNETNDASYDDVFYGDACDSETEPVQQYSFGRYINLPTLSCPAMIPHELIVLDGVYHVIAYDAFNTYRPYEFSMYLGMLQNVYATFDVYAYVQTQLVATY